MTEKHQKSGVTDPKDLLDLWMGDSDEAPASERPPGLLIFVALVCVGVLAVVLAKYAVDVLFILLALAALVVLGFLLHLIGTWLADSDVLSPAWFTIIVLIVALIAYMTLVPATLAGGARFVPEPVVRFLEWSESHGWAQRVFVGPPGGADTAPGPIGTVEVTTPARPTVAPGSAASQPASSAASDAVTPSLTLTASQSTSALGEPVQFTARLVSAAEPSGATPSVRFRDGIAVIGAADVRMEGQARVAYLTVRGLPEGRHEITAELVGALGLASARSAPLVHVVVAPSKR